MIVNYTNNQSALSISPSSVRPIIEQVLKGEKQRCDEVSIYFVDTQEICDLHQQFFNDPSPTDCISLPMDEEDDHSGYRLLGEVFICPETAIKYVHDHGQTDPLEETTLYMIHGILHLLGYDDIDEEEEKVMRKAEIKYLNKIKKMGLLLYS